MTKLETKLVQIGNRSNDPTGTINTPVYFSTAFRHSGIGESTGYDYTRTGNPTREVLEATIADLEGGDAGFACSSGMAAVQVIFSLFEAGDEIVVSDDLYGGTYRLFEEGWKRWGLTFRYVDQRNLEDVRAAIGERTKAIFIETPTNPLMQEADMTAIGHIARQHDLYFIVDNTFFTPLLQQPIADGADIVIHSATKYLGGHNDVLAGLIVGKGSVICERLGFYQNTVGATLSAFDSWLLMRGMKTLALRMRQHEHNAREVVAYFKQSADVTDVFYPGRGGMLSFRVADERWVNPLLQSLQLVSFAESLGGVESFMTYPATQTHFDIPEEIRTARGVCNRLLRFSVGIEHSADIIADIDQALQQAKKEAAQS